MEEVSATQEGQGREMGSAGAELESSSPGAGQEGGGAPGPELQVETEWEAHKGNNLEIPPTRP